MTPAPVWRRLAAIGYDALVLAALWMVAAMAVTLASQLVPISNRTALMRGAILLVGAAFFGWFWSHGGQTLGMRAWRVQLLRADGAPVRMQAAIVRYLVALLPLIAMLYGVAHLGRPALAIGLVGYLSCFVDPRKRALQDLVAGTEMVQRPRPSAEPAQPPERDEDERHRRQPG